MTAYDVFPGTRQKGKNFLPLLHELCNRRNCRLLYAVFFGSTLYGTAIEGKSDIDIKGIFLSSKRNILLGEQLHHLSFKTGGDNERNTEKDVDIDLWSLNYWLLDLLPKGDTGAIDLLFSPGHTECVIYQDPFLNTVFDNPLKFVDLRNQTGYISYAINQARKYGIKGSRLGVIKSIKDWLDRQVYTLKTPLHYYLDELKNRFGDQQYCYEIECNFQRSLFLCGKIHMGSTSMEEFVKRVNYHYQIYGKRARAAMLGQGIDWKALSHALRAIFQMQELMATGKIAFPLKRAGELVEIKTAQRSWPEVEKMILANLEQTKRMSETVSFAEYNRHRAEEIILLAFGESALR